MKKGKICPRSAFKTPSILIRDVNKAENLTKPEEKEKACLIF